ncbi:D(4) dopamine receptor isoform X2 [Syngnathus scovelli]|uniref:D(4) dopamine receptor isoform X2 n=1 Tax=Syngnathus scovelli TaxID=161590 RepID=UPI0035CA8C60
MPSAAGNCSTCGGGTRAAFLAANCLILASTATAGLAANAWVILAVCKRKSLRTWTNALVLNLAAADLLRCVCDCPALLAVLLLRDAGRGLCDVQVASFSFGCCAQLSTLACIGAERCRAVARPFEVGERRRQIRASVPLTWLSAALVACLCLTYAKDSPVHARIFDKGVFPVCQNDKAGEAGCEEPRRAEADPAPTKAPRKESGSSADDPGAPSGRKEGAAAEPFHGDQTPAEKSPSQEPATSLHVVAANIQGAVCMMPPTASRERNVKRKESKMAIRAGYIILTFLLFWTPLVTTVLINWMRYGNRSTQDATKQEVEILCVSITCMTSLSNPITYAAVNPHFRTEFYRLKSKMTSWSAAAAAGGR